MRRDRTMGGIALALALAGACSASVDAPAAPPPGASQSRDYLASRGWLSRIGWTPGRAYATQYGGGGGGTTIVMIDGGLTPRSPDFFSTGTDATLRRERLGYGEGAGRCQQTSPGFLAWSRPASSSVIADGQPNAGHGTVTTTLAAAPLDDIGLVGTAPEARLVIIRMAPRAGSSSYSGLLECALARAASAIRLRGSAVVNISFMAGSASAGVRSGIAKLVSLGALVVASAGNGGVPGQAWFPAALPHVLSVGDAERTAHAGSSTLDVVAPAGGIPAIDIANGSLGGSLPPETSWAAPLVSGLAATIWSQRPGTAQQVAWRLRASTPGGGKRWIDGRSGFGLVNLKKALDATAPADDELEPNDTMPLARSSTTGPGAWARLVCGAKSCSVRSGIIGTTDDPSDWFIATVRTSRARPCPRISGRGVRVGASRRLGSRLWAFQVVATAPLATYKVGAAVDGAGRCR